MEIVRRSLLFAIRKFLLFLQIRDVRNSVFKLLSDSLNEKCKVGLISPEQLNELYDVIVKI